MPSSPIGRPAASAAGDFGEPKMRRHDDEDRRAADRRAWSGRVFDRHGGRVAAHQLPRRAKAALRQPAHAAVRRPAVFHPGPAFAAQLAVRCSGGRQPMAMAPKSERPGRPDAAPRWGRPPASRLRLKESSSGLLRVVVARGSAGASMVFSAGCTTPPFGDADACGVGVGATGHFICGCGAAAGRGAVVIEGATLGSAGFAVTSQHASSGGVTSRCHFDRRRFNRQRFSRRHHNGLRLGGHCLNRLRLSRFRRDRLHQW